VKNRVSCWKLLPAGLIGTCLLTTGVARADIVVTVQSVTASPGDNGDPLEVDLLNTGPSAVDIAGFTFGISTANPEINFTGATTATGAPYIFAGDSLFGPEIATSIGQTLIASDLFAVVNSGVMVGSGNTVALGLVLFDVSTSAVSGTVPVPFVPIATSLSDPAGTAIPIARSSSGEITISGTVIPEPSLLLPIIGVLLLMGTRRAFRNSPLKH